MKKKNLKINRTKHLYKNSFTSNKANFVFMSFIITGAIGATFLVGFLNFSIYSFIFALIVIVASILLGKNFEKLMLEKDQNFLDEK